MQPLAKGTFKVTNRPIAVARNCGEEHSARPVTIDIALEERGWVTSLANSLQINKSQKYGPGMWPVRQVMWRRMSGRAMGCLTSG